MNNEQFKSFLKKANKNIFNKDGKAVIYTRVSTKEQAENNQSLTTQKKYCDDYAQKNGIEVLAYFGGSYESAKSDERKEFKKMLEFVNRRPNISYIIVYSFDRFSRTGNNGAYISAELKKKGIVVVSATQNIDSLTTAGEFQENLFHLFSQFDNNLRREKCVTGMKERLRRGYWVGTVPFGYTNLNPGKGKTPEYIINDDGKKLKYAFKWKAELEITHQEIVDRLAKKGLVTTEKKISKILKNPFYCGKIISNHVPNEIIEGKHPKIVSEELFLKVNGKLNKTGYGEKLLKDAEELPLKKFVKSANCGTPYTGYLAKKKGLWYYKNNRPGSCENRSAKKMNQKFAELLATYQITDEKFKAPLKDIILNLFKEINQEIIAQSLQNEKQIRLIEKKIERLEERYVFEEINNAQYTKFKQKLNTEKEQILSETEKDGIDLSNLEKAIENALNLSINLSKLWASGNLEQKRKIQKMVFPDGIEYDHQNDVYRTFRTNSIFNVIHSLSETNRHKKNGNNADFSDYSRLVPLTGRNLNHILKVLRDLSALSKDKIGSN